MNIESWLRSLGLECYAPAFGQHDIDSQVLRQLTAQDLIDIGVSPISHRDQLLDAIAALPSPAAKAVRSAAAHTALTSPDPRKIAGAERRQLTVLYCDMVGSTALSTRLDPEDMREVILRYHGTCTEIAARYDGYVANFIGDGLLVYFGWPQAHEDDSERAVRAGLELVAAVSAIVAPTGEVLAVRVGVATGAVVVGDLIRHGPAQEQSAVGETPNLAARLQALATPGQVVVDESTRRLLGATFDVVSLGAPALKGIARAVEVFWVCGEPHTGGRFEARSGWKPQPMVGRERELALLLDHWTQAITGNGQGVLVVGEAGIGKSRLCRGTLDEIAARPHHRIRLQCSPYHIDSALWPVIQHLVGAAKLRPDDSLDRRLDRLEALVAGDRVTSSLLAALVDLDGTARYGRLNLPSQQQRVRTLEVLVEQLLRLASQRPVIMVVEDAQWVDPTTLDMIGQCLDRIRTAKLMLVLTVRPDNETRLAAHPHLSRLLLERLRRPALEAIVVHIARGHLLAGTIATIIDRTDGVPLFAEELTRATLETGGTTVPASLHGSLMARLDRTPEVKEVAQVAACIGREFDVQLLAAVVDLPSAELSKAIERLTSAELVSHYGEHHRGMYTFKHALLQEAAYESLLRSKQQRLHARILEALEAGPSQALHELLGHHAARAGLVEKATEEWGLAGTVALAKSAYVEAANYLSSAIELTRSLDRHTDDWRSRELRLQVALGQARMATSGYGAEITRRSFERARELLDITQDKTLRFPVLYGLWTGYIMAVGPAHALQMGLDLLAAAEADEDEQTMLVAHRLAGSAHLESGQWADAKSHLERALSIYDKDTARHSNLSALYGGMEPGAAACSNLAVVAHVVGFPERGMGLAARVRGMAHKAPSANARASMYCECVNLAMLQRDSEWFERDSEVFTKLATENGLAVWRAYAVGMHAWKLLEKGQSADAIGGFRRCLAELTDCCARVRIEQYQQGLAIALGRCGRFDEATYTIDEALEESSRTKRQWFDAELWRARAELSRRGAPGPGDAQVVDCFERSLAISRAQGARAWELRAAVGLARQLARQGQHMRARELLSPVYESFTEGFGTVDLREAKILQSELFLN